MPRGVIGILVCMQNRLYNMFSLQHLPPSHLHHDRVKEMENYNVKKSKCHAMRFFPYMCTYLYIHTYVFRLYDCMTGREHNKIKLSLNNPTCKLFLWMVIRESFSLKHLQKDGC